MANGKIEYRAIPVQGMQFRFRVRQLETEFLFADGSIHRFANWDVKGLTERFYREEYLNAPVEEYLRAVVNSGEIVEYGIKTSDVRRFIEEKIEFFEDLFLEAANSDSLDAEENS